MPSNHPVAWPPHDPVVCGDFVWCSYVVMVSGKFLWDCVMVLWYVLLFCFGVLLYSGVYCCVVSCIAV